MNSREKRRVFRDAFKDRLFENGFVYKYNEFTRVHPSNVILSVALDLAPSGNGYLHFGAMPMCNMFEISDFRFLPRMDSLCRIYEQRQKGYIASLEGNINEKTECLYGIPMFAKQFVAFWDKIFDGLNAVHDIESAYAFAQSLPGSTNIVESIYYCIYFKKWDEALLSLNKLIQNWSSAIARDIQALTDLELKRPHMRKKSYEDYKAIYTGGLENARREKAHWDPLKELIEREDYNSLQAIVNGNFSAWDEYCQNRWPMFYK